MRRTHLFRRAAHLKRMFAPLPLAVLVVGLCATVFLAREAEADADHANATRYEALKQETLAAINTRLTTYEEVIRSSAACRAPNTSP